MDTMTRAAIFGWVVALVYSTHPEGRTRKMKRTLALIALLVAMACAVNASAAMVLTGNLAAEKVSATATNSTVTFPTNPAGGGSYDQDAVVIYNAGANEIYVAANAVATTASIEIPSGTTIALTGKAARLATLGIICDTDETATVHVWATYP